VHITDVKTVDCKRLNDSLLPNEMELTINEKMHYFEHVK